MLLEVMENRTLVRKVFIRAWNDEIGSGAFGVEGHELVVDRCGVGAGPRQKVISAIGPANRQMRA